MKARILALAAAALAIPAAHAATATWTGNTSTAWATPGNWANSYVAIDGDDLVIADSTKNGLTLDTSHSIGSLQFGTTGTRTGGFTFIIGVANTIAINGGITADGGFSAGTNALKLHGHTVIPTAQTWSVGGSADHSKDQGVAVREAAAGTAGRGSLTLDADLTKTGVGKLDFIAIDVTGPGNIVVNEGVLKLNAGNNQLLSVGGTGNLTVNGSSVLAVYKNSGTMNITRPIVMNDTSSLVTRNNNVDIASSIAFNGTHILDVGSTTKLTGTVTGTGSLTKTGTAALVLAGDATLDGQAIVNAGTLQIGNGGTTGTLAANIENNAAVAFNRSGNVSYGDVISGTGGLAKLGAGTLTLTAVQQYTGTTAVNAGTLRINVANALPAATAVTLSNTAGVTLDLNDRNQEIRSLRGGGTTGGAVTNSGTGASILTLRPAGTDDVTFSGTLDGNVRLVVAGDKAAAPSYAAPRQRLAGTASTYTGGTVVDGGTLLARTDGSLGAVPAAFDPANITLLNNGTLFNGAADFVLTLDANRGITLGTGGGALAAGFDTDVTVQGVITGDAGNNLTILENGRTVVLTADNTYAGNTIIKPASGSLIGRLQIGDGGTTGALGTGGVINDGQITFNRADGTSYDGSISGVGALTQAGSGTLTLNGSSSYTGATTVAAGVLAVNGSIATSSLTTVDNLATLQGTGTVGATTVATGGHVAPGNSIGTLTISGSMTINGTLDVEYDDSLSDQKIDLLAVSGDLVISAATVDFSDISTGTIGLSGVPYIFATYSTLNGGLGGTFATVVDLPSGYMIDYAYNGNNIALVPEPAAAMLAALGLLGLLRRRRR